MKSVSFGEYDDIVEAAQPFLGAKIDDIVLDNNILVLGLRGPKGIASLVVDVRHRNSFFIVTDQKLPRFQRQTKPIVLFLKAHAMGMEFSKIQRHEEYGRLIECVFTRENKTLTVEAHLFPQGKNIKVKTEDALICLNKPHEMIKVPAPTKTFEKRSLAVLFTEWLEQFEASGDREKPRANEALKEQILYKKEKGLEKLLENQKTLSESSWAEFAEWLNLERTEDVPKKYAELYDHDLSVIENIEHAFAEAKKVKAKLVNLAERIEDLQNEIRETQVAEAPRGGTPRPRENPLEGARGRTREFKDDIRAYIGKSGTDNLRLLRQSKAWYVWVHAKDWPSAHAIIACNKGQQIPVGVLREVCLWVLKETISDKQWQSWRGIKVDFLYTERRFLQPIKGDHHGRVRYTEAKTITLAVE